MENLPTAYTIILRNSHLKVLYWTNESSRPSQETGILKTLHNQVIQRVTKITFIFPYLLLK